MRNILLGSVAFLALTTNALANETAAAETAQDQATTAPDGEERAGINDIIVTASRRAENIQKSALSIQAISADDLIRANISKPEDLTAIAPGVQIGTAGPLAQVYIRGVGNYSTQVFAEGAVAFNLDGVYISRPWATRGMFYDLERVEVLKGPQGTLYGRNASGGAINVITAKPKLGEVSGFIEGQVGNYDLLEGTAAINVPLGSTAAIRASGRLSRRDGYLSDGTDDDRTQAARLQLLWEPSSDVSLLVSGHYTHIGGRNIGPVLTPQLPGDPWRAATDPQVTAIFQAEPGLGPLLTFPKDDGYIDMDVYAITGELNWDLGFAELTLLPAYREAKLRDLHYLPGFSVENFEHNKQTSVEARLGNDGEKLKWVLGAYYFNEQTNNLGGSPSLRVLQGFNSQIQQRLDLNTRSYAVFGQATYSLTDQFRVTGGLRYTYERKRDDELLTNYGVPNQAPPPLCNAGAFDPTTPYFPQFCRLDIPIAIEQTYNSVTWKAGVEYDVSPDSMAYANVSTGFKSGGFYSAPPPNTYEPEKVTAFDAGIKNRFLDNRLQVNLEVFYWKYTDHQESYTGPTTIPFFFTFLTVNAGKAKSYGADLDVLFKATPNDELSLKVQYNKTKYDEFMFPFLSSVFGPPVTGCAVGPVIAPPPPGNPPPGNPQVPSPLPGSQIVDCSGKSLVRAPLWNGTVGYRHTFDLGDKGRLTASFDTQFASASYLSIDFLEAGRQKAYAIGNFDLTYTSDDGRVTVSAFVRNIWDEAVLNQAFRSPFVSRNNPLADPDGVVLATIRPPRTFGGRVRVNF
jgi:iron complex outermembrane receptor protein